MKQYYGLLLSLLLFLKLNENTKDKYKLIALFGVVYILYRLFQNEEGLLVSEASGNCDLYCGEHGTCQPSPIRCICSPGWTGEDCSSPVTPPVTPPPITCEEYAEELGESVIRSVDTGGTTCSSVDATATCKLKCNEKKVYTGSSPVEYICSPSPTPNWIPPNGEPINCVICGHFWLLVSVIAISAIIGLFAFLVVLELQDKDIKGGPLFAPPRLPTLFGIRRPLTCLFIILSLILFGVMSYITWIWNTWSQTTIDIINVISGCIIALYLGGCVYIWHIEDQKGYS